MLITCLFSEQGSWIKGNLARLKKKFVLDFSSVDSNLNVVQDDPLSWWIDSGATRHECKNKQMFKTFHKVVDWEYPYMGNNSSSNSMEKGNLSSYLRWEIYYS